MEKMKKLKQIILRLLGGVFSRKNIKKFLKDKIVVFTLKKILGSAVLGGPMGWLASFVASELYDELALPIVNLALRRSGFIYHKVEGKYQVGKLKKAEGENNEDEYDDVVTDILS
jgi:hypothetical protein